MFAGQSCYLDNEQVFRPESFLIQDLFSDPEDERDLFLLEKFNDSVKPFQTSQGVARPTPQPLGFINTSNPHRHAFAAQAYDEAVDHDLKKVGEPDEGLVADLSQPAKDQLTACQRLLVDLTEKELSDCKTVLRSASL
jgi:hypothetical protein